MQDISKADVLAFEEVYLFFAARRCRIQLCAAQLYWSVVQTVERRTVNPYVAGSRPAIPATPHNANIEAREVKR